MPRMVKDDCHDGDDAARFFQLYGGADFGHYAFSLRRHERCARLPRVIRYKFYCLKCYISSFKMNVTPGGEDIAKRKSETPMLLRGRLNNTRAT